MKVTLSLTHRCNLACHYCYAGVSAKPDMTLLTAMKSVDFGLERTLPGKTTTFCLFGGEPLLRFDLVQEITAYIRRKSGELGAKAEITMTTNGTLVDDDVIDFAAENDLHLCFSLDGPAALHDRTRKFQSGDGSFATVMHNLEKARKSLPGVQVNAVYGPDTIAGIPENLDFFIETGLDIIHFNPDIKADWPESLYAEMPEIFRRAADRYIEAYQNGREIAVNLFDAKIILFLKGGYSESDFCSMGDGEWGIAPGGNIYPCERFIGDDERSPFLLGNVHTGLDGQRQCAMRGVRGNHHEECATCSLTNYCMNWCGCTNYFMSGRADIPAPVFCAMEQSIIRSARHVFDRLVQSGNQLFSDHIYGYISKTAHVPAE